MMTHLKQKFRGLLSSCRRWGHSSDEAEDLVQEALLAVEAYSRDHEVRNPHALLVTALKHHSINASRRAKRMTTVSMSDTGGDAGTSRFSLIRAPALKRFAAPGSSSSKSRRCWYSGVVGRPMKYLYIRGQGTPIRRQRGNSN